MLTRCQRKSVALLPAVLLVLAGCQPAPVVVMPEPLPEPAPRATLDPNRGVLAQLCAGARPVPEIGLLRSVEPDLSSADGSRVSTAVLLQDLHDDAATAALDQAMRADGPFCKADAPRRKSACGRWHSDLVPKKKKAGWACLVRRGCGEWGRDAELCVGFVDGAWYPRFLSERPGGELVGKRGAAMKRRVSQARRKASQSASKPSRTR